jgi:hypothetical protein
MDMYRDRIVKKPRKKYRCETCGGEITGEHIYNSQVWDGDFHTSREHLECREYRNKNMCYDCDCEGLTTDCFYEIMCRDCKLRRRMEEDECNLTIRDCILTKSFCAEEGEEMKYYVQRGRNDKGESVSAESIKKAYVRCGGVPANEIKIYDWNVHAQFTIAGLEMLPIQDSPEKYKEYIEFINNY